MESRQDGWKELEVESFGSSTIEYISRRFLDFMKIYRWDILEREKDIGYRGEYCLKLSEYW